MANPTPDFVQVQLSAKGQQLAGAHPLMVSNGRRSYAFLGGQSLKIELSYEWKAWLSRMHAPSGEAIFEIVPDPADPTDPAANVAAASVAGLGVVATGTPADPTVAEPLKPLNVPATGTPAAPAPGTKTS